MSVIYANKKVSDRTVGHIKIENKEKYSHFNY